MRLLHSLKSTHWVTWSSPLLLIVLVLTLTATSKPTSHGVTVSTITTTSLTSTSPHKKSPEATTTLPVKKATTPVTSSTSTTTQIAIPPTTIARIAVSSSNKTGSSVKPVAVASGETVASGNLSGQLTPSFNVADVPLVGPGTWSLDTSAPANASLQCANAVASVQSQIVVAAKASCQFIITTLKPSSSITWQLTPVN